MGCDNKHLLAAVVYYFPSVYAPVALSIYAAATLEDAAANAPHDWYGWPGILEEVGDKAG